MMPKRFADIRGSDEPPGAAQVDLRNASAFTADLD